LLVRFWAGLHRIPDIAYAEILIRNLIACKRQFNKTETIGEILRQYENKCLLIAQRDASQLQYIQITQNCACALFVRLTSQMTAQGN
jgi:hypothetical protein